MRDRLLPFAVRTVAVARKELLHLLRDYRAVYLALGLPLVLVVLFGYAITFDMDEVRVAVVDHDRSPASRGFIGALEASKAFRVVGRLEGAEEAGRLFRTDTARGVVVIPRGFARELSRGKTATFQLVLDGADGTSTRTALGYAAGISREQSIELLRRAGLEAKMPVQARVRTWFNPDMRSAVFVVPGLVALVLAILAVLLTALTVAREWERGSMEQLFATPVGRLSVVLGKLSPYVAVGFLQMLLVVTAGAWLFDVPLRGSFLLLLLVTGLFLICVLGQGLLISVITRNQQVATQAGAVSAMLPTLLLSGFIFPVENMPWLLRWISHVVPARYMIACLRGILLQGRGLAQLWPEVLGMAVLAAALVALCTVRFRRRLD